MEHVSGNIGNTVIHDYGDFLTIKNFRIRKEQILTYASFSETKEEKKSYWLSVWTAGIGHHISIQFDSIEDAESAAQKLDWEFKKK